MIKNISGFMGSCEGTLRLCVVLVINDTRYGLMLSLSFI